MSEMSSCHDDISLTRGLLHTRVRPILLPRGGYQEDGDEIIDLDSLSSSPVHPPPPVPDTQVSTTPSKTSVFGAILPSTVLSSFQSLTSMYATAIVSRPILTKSITAGFIFALSDYTAQNLNSDSSTTATQMNWIRTVSSGLVGLLYFGPAAHVWYQMIFQILPGTSLLSTLGKATLGQLIFGPSFTCVFFAVSLIQAKSFTLQNWMTKIQTDLPRAWVAGLSFWPLVDLISYSMVPKNYIPLFINFCSFVWTIYLSIVSNQKK